MARRLLHLNPLQRTAKGSELPLAVLNVAGNSADEADPGSLTFLSGTHKVNRDNQR